ncbi:MAG TPA: beta-propeller fold lactonase family protein [Pyrinomonadaceae bacterium]|nr:beta-propeller fold lactonase family protein [Pyrinomonadaceae bacterium]
MKTRNYALGIFVILTSVVGTLAQKTTLRPDNLKSGAVYVMTNQTANSVIAFSRDPKDGTLTEVDTELTQGAGNPVPPVDPLGSQGALILSDDFSFLFAVNAGSDEVSVLSVVKGGLDFVQKISSGGTRPISLTTFGNWLYVLNAGGTPNITGFTIGDDGTLTPIAGSTRPLIGGAAAGPAQVGFNNEGTLLAVTEKMGNRINTYTVDSNGVASAPISNPSSGMTPFGFEFTSSGFLIVSEAFGGMPNLSAVSSYSVSGSGTLGLESGSVPNQETAACWVVTTNSGKYAFVSNTGSATISSYSIAEDGALTLIDGAAAETGAGSSPTDMALSINSHFLYVLESASHTVSAYRIENGGALTFIDEFGTFPPGAQGIAAK